MSGKRKVLQSIENLEKALRKLELALEVPLDRELVLEGTIQRYEIVVELFWKTLLRALEYEGVEVMPSTPRQALKESIKVGWLHEDETWQSLVDRRNTTSHEYLDEEFALETYNEVKRAYPLILPIFQMLKKRY